jgi:putative FmdB family regulatory protein
MRAGGIVAREAAAGGRRAGPQSGGELEKIMPTYEYRCRKGHQFEVFHGIHDTTIQKCPICGARARKVPAGGAGLIFKGSGFYITDYRSKDYKEKAKQEKSNESKPASGESKSSSGESKPSSGDSRASGGSKKGQEKS